MTSRSPDDVAASSKGRRDRSSQRSGSHSYSYIIESFSSLDDWDDDLGLEGPRPLSFLPGLPHQEELQSHHPQRQKRSASAAPACSTIDQPQASTSNSYVDKGGFRQSQNIHQSTMSPCSLQEITPPSPSCSTPSLREVQIDPSLSLANIDDPKDIAQELSNLQALRRLSMDVGNSIDPDMPSMPLASIPPIAPRAHDEHEPSILLWVPARVHPELAPSEFKSFLESRLQSIRRRSGDSFFDPSDDSRRFELASPTSMLRRKKSMLSRQIHAPSGRVSVGNDDDRERLERGSPNIATLNLDDLVKDPTRIVQQLAQESPNFSGALEIPSGNDLPILPIPPGAGLRRSTRTTYRKGGSFRSGDRSSFSRRMAQRDQEDSTEQTSSHAGDVARGFFPPNSSPEPLAGISSNPRRSVRRQQKFLQYSSSPSCSTENYSQSISEFCPKSTENFEDQTARTHIAQQVASPIELTNSEETEDNQDHPYLSLSVEQLLSETSRQGLDYISDFGEDHSADQHVADSSHDQVPASNPQPQSRSSIHIITSSFPGESAVYTEDTLTPICPPPEDRKIEKKSRKDRDEDSLNHSSKTGSTWKWFKGAVDDKDKRKDESKKSKSRSSGERTQDHVRLDLIQLSIDKPVTKSRETLASDRDNVNFKSHEDRKKENSRRSDSKKEKDGNIFSSIFGGGKKKDDKEKIRRNQHYLSVPEDPPYTPLKPDVDYNWSRFPLLEERAIYRMAHIKLANPRRSLHSQVLLSNFMYSYLAIVQAMHPQMNVPISPQQKRLEEEARRRKEEQRTQEQQCLIHSMAEKDPQQACEQIDYKYHGVGSHSPGPGFDSGIS